MLLKDIMNRTIHFLVVAVVFCLVGCAATAKPDTSMPVATPENTHTAPVRNVGQQAGDSHALAAAPASGGYSLIGTIQSQDFSGAVIRSGSSDQTYRLGEKLPDGSQIIKVQSDSILLKDADGMTYEMFILHESSKGGAGSASVDTAATQKSMNAEQFFAAQAQAAEGRSGVWHAFVADMKQRFPLDYYVDVLYGSVSVDNASASATVTGPPCFAFSCTTYSTSNDVELSSNDMIGVRWGGWGRFFGFGLELDSKLRHNSQQVTAEYFPISLLPLVRIPIVLQDAAPRQQVDLYGGVSLILAVGGSVSVSFPELPGSASGSGGSGYGPVLGISWRYSNFAAFLEQRRVSMDVGNDSADVRFDLVQRIFGLSWRF